jgi:hypothetical protein
MAEEPEVETDSSFVQVPDGPPEMPNPLEDPSDMVATTSRSPVTVVTERVFGVEVDVQEV